MNIYYITKTSSNSNLPQNFKNISINSITNKIPEDADTFVLSTSNFDIAYKIISLIRKSPMTQTYLAPVFFINSLEYSNINIYCEKMFDSTFYSPEINQYIADKIYEAALPITKKIKQIPSSKDAILSMKIIRFMFSRNHELTPIMTSDNLHGFIYPKIKTFLQKNDYSFFKLLNFMESNDLIEGQFYDIAHFCSKCGSAFLNFREVCPQCSSANIKAQDLIHHFKCAYIAPEEEFYKNGKSICPKCKDELNHIGVDFDKPSIIYNCRNCGHVFQEPSVDSKCYNCQITNLPENQSKIILKKYTLTSIGQNSCIHGLDTMFKSVLKEDLPLIPYNIFKKILTGEIERIKRYSKSVSTLAYFEIENIEEIYTKFGAKAKNIFLELSTIIKNILRLSDYIASVNDSIFLCILTETDEKGAKVALSRVEIEVDKLVKKNADTQINIKTKLLPIIPAKQTEQILKEILNG